MASGSGGREREDQQRSNEQPHNPQHGNFRHYYSIRREGTNRPSRDPRLDVILPWLESHEEKTGRVGRGEDRAGTHLNRILDVGCNNGRVTLQLCMALQEDWGVLETVVGVDVDRELVTMAGDAAKRMQLHTKRESADDASLTAAKVLGSGRVGRGVGGPRKRLRLDDADEATTETKTTSRRPLYRFLQSNWVYNDDMSKGCGEECPSTMTRMQWCDMAEVEQEDQRRYNLIFALSVTKWIHIHHHDSGLRRFFARVAACLDPDGIFIIEPQAYKSYKHTLKVTAPTSQPRRNFYALRVMPDDFEWILSVELGFQGPYTIRAKGQDASIRQIDAYIQPAVDCIPRHCLDRRAALLAMPLHEDPLAGIDDEIPWVARKRE